MKEKITLASLFWKCFFLIAVILFMIVPILAIWDLEWYWCLLSATLAICLLFPTYFVLRVRLIINYGNKKIIYYGFKKCVTDFEELQSCQGKTEERMSLDLSTTTYHYLCIKKADGSVVKISMSFIAFKDATRERVRKDIEERINNIINAKSTKI